MSHGCINLTIANAKLLYDWAYRGTEVSVHY
jgi:lipoprotein-anchoring transpeptidase ErfK/SrfK